MGSALHRCHLRRSQHKSLSANAADHRPLVSLVDLATQSPHVNVHEIGLGDELVFPDFAKKHCPRQHLALAPHHIFEQKELTRHQIDRTLTRRAVRVRRSSCSGPTLRTVFRLSVGRRRSSTSLARNSATATTLAGFIFIGKASVLENRDEAERISSALLLVIEFSFPAFSSPRDRSMKPGLAWDQAPAFRGVKSVHSKLPLQADDGSFG